MIRRPPRSTHVGAPLQIAAQVSNLTVTRGGTTSTVFNVDAGPGLGAITFACSGLPAGAACSFNPSSTTQISSQVTMTITLPLPAATNVSPRLPGPLPPYAALLALMGLTALIIRSQRVRMT